MENYIIIASLKSETMSKLIHRIPGSSLLISSLPGSALRTLVESLGKPRDVNKHFKALPGKLDFKSHSPISILFLQPKMQRVKLGIIRKFFYTHTMSFIRQPIE